MSNARLAVPFVASLVLLLINVVPFLGWIIALLNFMAGLGAAASAVTERPWSAKAA